MDKTYITQLLQLYFTNQANHAQREALFAEIEKHKDNHDWEELFMRLLPIVNENPDYNPKQYQSLINSILAQPGQPKARVLPLYKKSIFKWVAAACIILIIGISTYVILSGVEGRHKEQQIAQVHDVPAPTNTRAVITLANGQKVYLDSASNGTIAQQSNVSVVKNSNGEILYLSPAGGGGLSESPNNQRPGVVNVSYNTLFNPRGSKVISLTLSDGTRVWLNSESSLRYPASFASAQNREVEISGEAYFEVKHNAKQPFKVRLPNGSIVEDIGTSFNINAYSDEADIKTTLIEGSVKVVGGDANNKQKGGSGVTLKPGQQAVLNQVNPGISRIGVQTNVDLDAVLAWKNGYFQFNNASLQDVLRQLTRWYDVDIVYEAQPGPRQFVGEMERTLSLQQVLAILEKNHVRFRVEGRTITVSK